MILTRLDIKTVKNRKYLQFIDGRGDIFHIGSASDFNSWLIGLIIWDKEWRDEYFQRRADFFEKVEYELSKYVQMDALKIDAIDTIRSQESRYSKVTRKKLKLPKMAPFGELELNDNIKQSRWKPRIWIPSEIGRTVQKRLDEISSKQRQLAKRYKNTILFEEKEKRLREIMKQRKEIMGETDLYEQKNVLSILMNDERKPKNVREKMQLTLSVLIEMEREMGMVEKKALVSKIELKHKIPRDETERLVWQLLREGTIYEHREGYLKKT